MTELGTALREQADRQQPVGGQEPGELWSRGRQRVRRRRVVGVAVVFALVAAVGTSALLVPAPTVVMPAGEPHAPAIPKDIYTPNQHLAGTVEKGPLGQIAVMAGAQRANGLGLFGISARTGEYRFIDLPDVVDGPPAALSPDGNHIAYWYGPYPGSTPPPGDALAPAHGAAIYDTRTGAVQKAPISSKDGVVPSTLAWFDDSTMSFSFRGRMSATPMGTSMIWRLGNQPRRSEIDVPAPKAPIVGVRHDRDGSVLFPSYGTSSFDRYAVDRYGDLRSTGSRLMLPDPPTPESAPGQGYSAVSISGGVVLAVPAVAGALAHPLMVGHLPQPQQGPFDSPRVYRVRQLALVGQLQDTLFLGWRDDHTALVAATGKGAGPELFEADLRARTVRRVGVADPQNYQPLLTVATDLVSQPMVAGRRPPDPQVPVAWLALAGLLAVAGVLGLVRRRRRA